MSAFSGLDALIRGMKALSDELKGKAGETIQDVANQMEEEVRSNYVTGPTGNLRKGVGQRRLSPLAIRVHSRAKHAHIYEFGSVLRHHANGKSVGRMPPLPTNRNFTAAAIKARKKQMVEHEDMLRKLKVPGMEGSAT
jgi:hypothetical protein